MEGFSQEEKNKERKKHEEELLKEGAMKMPDGRLHITQEQYGDAHLEMNVDLLDRPILKFEGESEVLESRTFSPEEIKGLIAELEEIRPSDIVLEDILVDSNENIIEMSFRLNEEVAYDKYGRPVEYEFTIKGNYIPKEITKGRTLGRYTHRVTTIDRYLAATEDEKEKGEDLYTDVQPIAKYKNGKWITLALLLNEDDE